MVTARCSGEGDGGIVLHESETGGELQSGDESGVGRGRGQPGGRQVDGQETSKIDIVDGCARAML